MTDLDAATSERATLETAPTRYIEGGGIRFAYRLLGPSTGTALVLLQHFSGNIDAWDPAVVNPLALDRPVIAFDNAGVGRSTGKTPDNVAAMARDAVTFLGVNGGKISCQSGGVKPGQLGAIADMQRGPIGPLCMSAAK